LPEQQNHQKREDRPGGGAGRSAARKLSIIVPVYNEEQTINEVIERVLAVDLGDIEREVIIANDGSQDGTRRRIEERGWLKHPVVRLCENPINLGKGAAVRHGLSAATGDLILVQDADLELNPTEYGALLAPILAGQTDVLYGSRFLRPSHHIPRRTRLANRFLTTLTNLLFGARLTDMETAYKVFRRDVISTIRLRAVGFDFEPEVTARLLLAGHRIVEVPIGYEPRTVNEGKKIGWVDGVDAVNTLLKCRFSTQHRTPSKPREP
jgi:glycosyltransferase involved in cell wall biosynthesis